MKTWPEPFQAVWDESKPYEVRKDDRAYAVGDLLFLREWSQTTGIYSGRAILARVSYMTPGGEWGLPPGLCVLGLVVYACMDNVEWPSARRGGAHG